MIRPEISEMGRHPTVAGGWVRAGSYDNIIRNTKTLSFSENTIIFLIPVLSCSCGECRFQLYYSFHFKRCQREQKNWRTSDLCKISLWPISYFMVHLNVWKIKHLQLPTQQNLSHNYSSINKTTTGVWIIFNEGVNDPSTKGSRCMNHIPRKRERPLNKGQEAEIVKRLWKYLKTTRKGNSRNI